MDDIAACIKDHQYNEALRKTHVNPEEALVKAIIERIPTKKGNEIEPAASFVAKLTLDSMLENSIGRYFLCECARESNEKMKDAGLVTLQDYLDLFNQYKKSSSVSRHTCELLHNKVDSALKGLGLPETSAIEEVAKRIEADEAKCGMNVNSEFEPINNYLKSNLFEPAFEGFKKHETFPSRYRDSITYRERAPELDDFIVFRDLGRGAFGVVSGARHRITGQLVALKGMNRKLIKGKKVLSMVKVEFEVLKELGENPSPFCVSLLFSFMDAVELVFGLPLCTGGDLMYHLRSNRRGFGVEKSTFFAAEVLMGLEHLHSLGILYRDLKPENVLLDERGHAKISDMGLAILTGHTPQTIGDVTFKSKAGTPGYWPPEMIKKEGYAFDADWWSFGVLLYEFLVGICAFSESHTKCKDRNEATLTWEIEFPETSDQDPFPEEAKDLILQLLNRDRATRLGAKPNAVELLKGHPFFSSIKWNVVASGQMTPPWVPPADAINAASQEEIQERSKEHEFKKLKLTEEDNIEGITYSSAYFERDLVQVLRLERDGKLSHLKQSATSATCAIL